MAAIPLSISGKEFWPTLTKNVVSGGGVAHCIDGDLQYAAVDASSQLCVIRRTAEELFSATVLWESSSRKLKAVVNGSLWGLTANGKSDVLWGHDPVPAADTLVEGQVVEKGVLLTGSSEPDLCYIAHDPLKAECNHKFSKNDTPESVLKKYRLNGWDEILSMSANSNFKMTHANKKTKKFDPSLIRSGDEFKVPTPADAYMFGRGDPPRGSAITAMGGLAPMIIAGLKYGTGNKYGKGVPAGAPTTGEPGTKYQPFLTQRNDNRYAGQAAKMGVNGGKAAVALCRSARTLLFLVLPHNSATGLSTDDMRDKLAAVGVEDALMLDGSDSVMLMVKSKWQIRQGENKDEGTTVGLAFK